MEFGKVGGRGACASDVKRISLALRDLQEFMGGIHRGGCVGEWECAMVL